MLENEIEALANRVKMEDLKGFKKEPWLTKNVIMGSFDTEYTTTEKGFKVLSFQISIDGHQHIYYLGDANMITEDLLKEKITEIIDEHKITLSKHGHQKNHIYLASYFSNAELSTLDNFFKWTKIRGLGNVYNVDFEIKNGYKVTIFDVWHFFQDMKTPAGKKDLGTISEMFELGGKIEHPDMDKKHMDVFLKEHPEEFEEYGLKDIEVTEKLFRIIRKEYWDTMGIDILQYPTAGSVAVAAIRKTKLRDLSLEPFFKPLLKDALKSAHGALMVAFDVGAFENVYEADFTGFYTYTLKNTKILPTPQGLIETTNLETILSGYDGFGEFLFEYPDNYPEVIPLLPVQQYIGKSKQPSVLMYPTSGTSFCTVSEVRVAMSLGCKVELVKGYYYKEGLGILAEFAEEQILLREKARVKKNFAKVGIHKTMPNTLVGKFFEHHAHFDIKKAQEISDILGCELVDVIKKTVDINASLGMLLKTGDIDKEVFNEWTDKSNLRIGSMFYPIWWLILLGRARAAMAYTVHKYGKDKKILHISTDSFHAVDCKINETFIVPFGIGEYKIGDERGGQRMYLHRTKNYTHGDKVAHHSLHMAKEDAKEVLEETLTPGKTGTLKYGKKKFATLREAAINKTRFREETEKPMIYCNQADDKMCMENGKMRPWKNFKEYEAFVLGGERK